MSDATHLLLVQPDRGAGHFAPALRRLGHTVDIACSGPAGFVLALGGPYDAIEVRMSRLRAKLRELGAGVGIAAVRGTGFRLTRPQRPAPCPGPVEAGVRWMRGAS